MDSLKNYLTGTKSAMNVIKAPSTGLEKKTRKKMNRKTYFGRWYGGGGVSQGTGGNNAGGDGGGGGGE